MGHKKKNIYIYLYSQLNLGIQELQGRKSKGCGSCRLTLGIRSWEAADVVHSFSAPYIYLVMARGCWQIRLRDLGEWHSWPHPHKFDVHFGDRGINTGFYASLPVSLPPEGKPWHTAQSNQTVGFNYALVKTLLFLYPRTMAGISNYCRLPPHLGGIASPMLVLILLQSENPPATWKNKVLTKLRSPVSSDLCH